MLYNSVNAQFSSQSKYCCFSAYVHELKSVGNKHRAIDSIRPSKTQL